jgi:hypothetical protein
MARKLTIILLAVALCPIVCSGAHAAGEDVLAASGQYTFFIKPEPCSPTTYYQKLVPCVVKQTIPVPRRVVQTYQVPMAALQNTPVLRTETPVGCADGQDACIDCFPKPKEQRGVKQMPVPRLRPVRVETIEYVPKEVTKRVFLPQWFRVDEMPLPQKPVRKVGPRG